MEVKYKSIKLDKESGALRNAEIEFCKVLKDDYTKAPEDIIVLRLNNDSYSEQWAPIEFIIDCLLIPAIKDYERKWHKGGE